MGGMVTSPCLCWLACVAIAGAIDFTVLLHVPLSKDRCPPLPLQSAVMAFGSLLANVNGHCAFHNGVAMLTAIV